MTIREEVHKSASQLLIETLDQFSNIEGRAVVIAFTDDERAVEVRTNAGRIVAVGLLRVAEEMVRQAGKNEVNK